MALQISGTCHYHPMRAGIGVCVECRQVVCVECSTQFEGINRCAACLSRLSKKAGARVLGADRGAGGVATLLLVFGLLFGALALLAQTVAAP